MSRLQLTLFLALAAGGAAFVSTPAPESRLPPAESPLPPPALLQPPVSAGRTPITQSARVEMVFVLDTTGSMGGMLQSAKDTIWSIVDSLASQKPRPEIRIGFVAFRDRGDDYVTLRTPLSADLDAAYASLLALEAGGGGDGPESVNQGLHEAITQMDWSEDGRVYRAIFVVGDAPPHMDYEQDVPYSVSLAEARQRRIVVSAIRCGSDPETGLVFSELAALGKGSLIEMPEAIVRKESPVDGELARLQAALAATALPYGTDEEQAAYAERLRSGSSTGAVAARAAWLSRSGGRLGSGGGELLDDLGSGKVKLEELPEERLPAALRGLSPTERTAAIEARQALRKELQRQIDAEVRRRDAWLADDRQAKLERSEKLSFSEEVDGFAVGQLRALGYVE